MFKIMPKNVEKMAYNYSINFYNKKRSKKQIKYLIYHYTGMKNDDNAIRRLTSPKKKVSCHYYINQSGKIIQMVPDKYIAWHAGISSWKKDKLLNSKSLGIEISNPGHENGYKKFNKSQIKSIKELSLYLIKKYKINKTNILGHSDISPLRKKDPGEKFPWEYLAKKKIGIWHKLQKEKISHLRKNKIFNKIEFWKNLKVIGYSFNLKNNLELKKTTISFQRRFRPELINGEPDKECFEISKSLKNIRK